MKLKGRVDACRVVHWDGKDRYVQLSFRIVDGYDKRKGATLARWRDTLATVSVEVKRVRD